MAENRELGEEVTAYPASSLGVSDHVKGAFLLLLEGNIETGTQD